MKRREFITAGVAVSSLITGCTRGGGSGTVDDSPTSTPENDRNDGGNRESTDANFQSTPIRECPTRPANFTAENIFEYATAFEQAYKSRQLVNGEKNAVSVSYKDMQGMEEGATVTTVDEGFLIEFGVSIGFAARYDQTDSVVYGDKQYDVKYFINDTSVLRLERKSSEETLSDPRESGAEVECSS